MLRRKLYSNLALTENESNNNKRPKVEQNELALDLSIEKCLPADRSRYFPNIIQFNENVTSKVLEVQQGLNQCLRDLSFVSTQVRYVYNPLEYAWNINEMYVNMYCNTPKKLLFVGMNPGPSGMCQTGVPFGDVNWVVNWLKLKGEVFKPSIECPARPVTGFGHTKKEPSGDKFWSLLAKLCGTPEKFFQYSFVYNYCPLAFMEEMGRNVTPKDLKGRPREELESRCDAFYNKIIQLLQPEVIIGIGEYAEKRTSLILKANNLLDKIKVIRLPHPSPRTPNNQNWSEKAEKFFLDQNLLQYFN